MRTSARLLILVVAANVVACRRAGLESSSLRLHEQSSQVVAFETWPGIFVHAEPEVCTATAISPRLLITAAHCIPGDSMKVHLVGTPEDLKARVGEAAMQGYSEGLDESRGSYSPPGLAYRSTKVHKLVEYGESLDGAAELHPAFRDVYTGIGVTPSEFYGRDGDKIGALDVAIIEFDRDIFTKVHAIDWDYNHSATAELVSVGHGRKDDAGNYDGKRRQAKVGGELKFDNGTVRSRVPFADRANAVLTGGDSGGPLMVRVAEGEFKIIGIAQSGVLFSEKKLFGTLSDVPENLKTTDSAKLFRESIWVALEAGKVRDFVESKLSPEPAEASYSPDQSIDSVE